MSSGACTRPSASSPLICLPSIGRHPEHAFVTGAPGSREKAISWSAASLQGKKDVKSVKICCVTTLSSSRWELRCCFLLLNLLISKSSLIKSYLCFCLINVWFAHFSDIVAYCWNDMQDTVEHKQHAPLRKYEHR